MPRAVGAAFSENVVAYATGSKAFVLRRADGAPLACFDKMDHQYTVHITPDEKTLIVRGTADRISFYDLETFTLLRRFGLDSVACVDGDGLVSPDGRYFYVLVERDSFYSSLVRIDLRDFSMKTYLADTPMYMSQILYLPDEREYRIFGYRRLDEKGKNQNVVVGFDGEEILSVSDTLPKFSFFSVIYCSQSKRYYILPLAGMHAVMEADASCLIQRQINIPKRGSIMVQSVAYHSGWGVLLASSFNALYAIDPDSGEVLADYPKEYGFSRLQILEDCVAAFAFGRGVTYLGLEGRT